MSIKTNIALANKQLDTIFNAAAGITFDSGTLKFYTGAQPATADTVASGTLVVTISLAADSFAAASARGVSANSTPLSANAAAGGTIGWMRMSDSGGTYVVDSDVSLTGGGSAVTVDNTTLTSGQQCQVTSIAVTL